MDIVSMHYYIGIAFKMFQGSKKCCAAGFTIIVLAVATLVIIFVWKGEEIAGTFGLKQVFCKQEIQKCQQQAQQGGTLFAIEPVIWDNPEKPMESDPLQESEIPKTAIKVAITEKGFSPSLIEKSPGVVVVLALTAKDNLIHIFRFRDQGLSRAGIGVSPGETRAVTFYAPKAKGEYEFFCDMPGHIGNGEVGKLVVK